MIKAEARTIKELQIHPTELEEDLFYYEMAKRGHIPSEHATKAIKRIEKDWSDIPMKHLKVATRMVNNVEKYGVACADWCKE